MFARIAAILSATIFMAAIAIPALAVELVMVDQQGCVYCEQWEREIGPIYPKTVESHTAPLRHVDIGALAQSGIELVRTVHFTPTFLLVDNNRELARIEGYPGEDFFWGLLEMMLKRHTDFGGDS